MTDSSDTKIRVLVATLIDSAPLPPPFPPPASSLRRYRLRRIVSLAAVVVAVVVVTVIYATLTRTSDTATVTVATGAPTVWVRSNGPESAAQISAATSSSRGVVAVGNGIWFSPDGATWTAVLGQLDLGGSPLGQLGVVNTVTALGSGFVAGGQAVDPRSRQAVAAIWTSPDGRRWTRVQDPTLAPRTPPIPTGNSTPTRGSIHAITAGGPGLVAVGGVFAGTFDGRTLVTPADEPAIWISTDQTHWTRVNTSSTFGTGPSQLQLTGVTSYRGSVIATASDGPTTKIYSSRDATHWQLIATIAGTFAHLGGQHDMLVAVGSQTSSDQRERAAVWTSPDGRHWHRALTSRPAGLASYTAVATTSYGLIAVGYRGNHEPLVDAIVSTSTDGETWKPVTTTQQVFAAHTYLEATTSFKGHDLAFGIETTTGTGTQTDPFRPTAVIYTAQR
jgi:hypothetical protein